MEKTANFSLFLIFFPLAIIVLSLYDIDIGISTRFD